MANGWNGRRVTRLRAYWGQRIADAYTHGKPLTCWRCPRIGRLPHPLIPGEGFQVDHIEELSKGGAVWLVSNTAPSCAASNQAHGAHLTNTARSNRTGRTRPWPAS